MNEHRLYTLVRISTLKVLNSFKNYCIVENKSKDKLRIIESLIKCKENNISFDEIEFKNLKNKTRLLSSIFDLLSSYLAVKEMSKSENKSLKDYIFLQFLKTNTPFAVYEQFYQKTVKKIHRKEYKNMQEFQTLQWIEHEYYFHPFNNNIKKYVNSGFQSLFTIQQNLNISFILFSLKYASELLVLKDFSSRKIEFPDINFLLKESRRLEKHSVLFKIYRLCIESFSTDSTEVFQAFKTTVFEDINNIELTEQSAIFNLLVSKAATALKKDKFYLNELENIYTIGIANNYFLELNKLSNEHFMNYVNILCAGGKPQIAVKFVKEFSNLLNKTNMATIIDVANSRIAHCKGDYKKAFELLSNMTQADIQLVILSRNLKLLVLTDWYLIGDSEMELNGEMIEIKTEFEAHRAWIRRIKTNKNKELIKAIDSFFKFVKKIFQISKIANPADKSDEKNNQLKLLSSMKFIVFRLWLENKISSL